MGKNILSTRLFLLVFLLFTAAGCSKMKTMMKTKQRAIALERTVSASDVQVPPGYKVEAVATSLTFPSGVTFDEQGNVYFIEAGYSYIDVFKKPRLAQLMPNGETRTIAEGEDNGPWNGVTYKNGNFYIAEGNIKQGGRILRISKDGQMTAIVENLPRFGDHQTNGPVIGNDGYIYFGQGTTTNSAVVGKDNYLMGWLANNEQLHDIPCEDIILSGKNFTTPNILSGEGDDMTTTGAYVPYGTATKPGQVIKGRVPCTGAIMRVRETGGPVELVAWGFRNPYGMAFSPDGRLFITENSYDARGTRPIVTQGDHLWEVKQGAWYGWPDFEGGVPLNSDKYKRPGEEAPAPLLQQHPSTPPQPAAVLGIHSSSNGIAFSNDAFAFAGQAFIAQFGDMTPTTGTTNQPTGFKVVRVDVNTGQVTDFATNKKPGPSTAHQNDGGLERPLGIGFSPDGRSMYIADFGIMTVSPMGPTPQEGTGVIWKITKQ
ncbi:PQQ-dependent sugar dehydrogenase [Pontibacter locisalis]|uniref:PQQ-dependent sugar dehydrogenase n=1 Tax=Pontibacter locisalis TaxID=1719035 RepID=A0ABW5IUR2_9BACT